MNVQHSSRTDMWYTPQNIVEKVKQVLGTIDLDPASDQIANERIGARTIITREQDGLKTDWAPGSVFLNPPGGRSGKGSITGFFWGRLMQQRDAKLLSHGIFMAFSLEALAVSQGYGSRSIGTFPCCIPRKRIAFIAADGSPGDAPSHANCIAYVPGTVDRSRLFTEIFQDLGVIINRPGAF